MVSCQKGPTCHAYAWQIGPFWQDTLDMHVFKFHTNMISFDTPDPDVLSVVSLDYV